MIGFQPPKGMSWGIGSSLGLLVFFIFLAGVAIFNSNNVTYPRDDKGLELYHGDQCERPVDHGWMVEVQNTLSNAGYALAGTLILIRAASWSGLMLGANLLILGLMSALYHATLGHGTPQQLDVAWVYAALLALSVYASFVLVQRQQPLKIPIVAAIVCGGLWLALGITMPILFGWPGLAAFFGLSIFVVGAGVLCYVSDRILPAFVWITVPFLAVGIPLLGLLMKISFGWDSDAVFAILISLLIIQLVATISGAEAFDGWRLAWELPTILLLLVVGLVFRLGDGYSAMGSGDARTVGRKFLCDPDGPFQAHAGWHLLGALALLLGYDLLSQFQSGRGKGIDKPVIFPDAAVGKT